MKKKNIKSMLRIFACVGLIVFIFIQAIPQIYKSKVDSIQKTILCDYPEVKSVDIVEDQGVYALELTLDISFYDGQRLILERVDGNARGSIQIKRINEYGFFNYIQKKDFLLGGSFLLENKLLEKETGLKLESVGDIIKNFNVIYEYVIELPDINASEYSKYDKTTNWVWRYDTNLRSIAFEDDIYMVFKEKR